MADGNGLNQGPNLTCSDSNSLTYQQVKSKAAQLEAVAGLYLKAQAKMQRIQAEIRAAQRALQAADEELARLVPYSPDETVLALYVDGQLVVLKVQGEPQYNGADVINLWAKSPDFLYQEEADIATCIEEGYNPVLHSADPSFL